MFEYFKAMRTTKSHLRYFDYLGKVLDAQGKTGGQQTEHSSESRPVTLGDRNVATSRLSTTSGPYLSRPA